MRWFFSIVLSCAIVAFALPARAADRVVVWPTLTPIGGEPTQVPAHPPTAAESDIYARAAEIDGSLRDGVQDLGFVLDVSGEDRRRTNWRETDMIELAQAPSTDERGAWVVSPRVEYAGLGMYWVRIVVVPPNGHELRVRVEHVSRTDVAARALIMLRSTLKTHSAARKDRPPREPVTPDPLVRRGVMTPLRSQGRGVLAINGALWGAFAAFSIQRASGSSDPRVLYPLLALGTGVGIGSTLLVSEEWDVSTGNAWYLAAGAWWGTASGIALANGAESVPLTDRYAFGVGGGLAGIALSTLALTRSNVDEGGALLTHSGAAVGAALGAGLELGIQGTTTSHEPWLGTGVGSATGLLLAGGLATVVKVSPNRVLMTDIGAGLGGLAGAAAASPLVFEDVTPTKARTFLAITAAGAIGGGTLAYFLSKDRQEPSALAKWQPLVPRVGVVGASATPSGAVPAYGLSWGGAL